MLWCEVTINAVTACVRFTAIGYCWLRGRLELGDLIIGRLASLVSATIGGSV